MTTALVEQLILILSFVKFISSQSAASIALDNSLCLCDLTAKLCDLNCCCDNDCSNTLKSQFTSCSVNNIVTNNRVCSYNIISLNSSNQQISTLNQSSNGFCVYTSNYYGSDYYIDRSIVRTVSDLQSNISTYSLSQTPEEVTIKAENINKSNSFQYPTGFLLSGNIGYETGKPVMRAVQFGQLLSLQSNPNEWWSITTGDSCNNSQKTESVKFGINLLAGCSIRTSEKCAVIQQYAFTYLGRESDLNSYRIASFANITLNNLKNWVNITIVSGVPASGPCSVLTRLEFEILYARSGSTQYSHNKIIGIRAQSIYSSVTPEVSGTIYLSTIVNFLDVTPASTPATKLSPFLNIKLPYDFYFPIYTP